MKTYTIKKGSNYCREWWRKRLLWKPRGMVAKVKFNGSAIYESEFDGWQKIAGFSLGNHHDNSFRFVWRVVNGFFQIGAYQYVGGVRQEARMCYSQKLIERKLSSRCSTATFSEDRSFYDFPYDFTYDFELKINLWESNGLVRYQVNDEHPVFFTRPKTHPFPSIGYALQPYYEQPKETPTTAPHDIIFEMEVKYY